MNKLETAHHTCGYNDIAYGLVHWTGSDTYQSPFLWAIAMKAIALNCQPKTTTAHDRAYYQGCIDACNHYQTHGKIALKDRDK